MKKLLVVLCLYFIADYSFAQSDTTYPSPPQQLGRKNVVVIDSGGLFVKQTFVAPIFEDTLSANAAYPYTKSYTASIIYTRDIKAYWFRQDLPRKWVIMGSSNGNNNLDTIYTEIPIAVKTDSLGRRIIYLLHANGLYSGGVVTVDSCMTIDITASIFYVNYRQYNGLQTIGKVITAADPTFPRTDRVVIDTNLVITVIAGTPSATPIAPPFNSSYQVSLAEIPVAAAITCLGTVEIIFDGAADYAGQWTPTTSGTGSTSFTNTLVPYHLTQASYTLTYSNGYQLIYTKPSGTDTVKATSVLKGFVNWVGGLSNGNQLLGQWYNGATAVSNQLLLNTYFNGNDSNNYQIIAPPLNAWSWPGGTVYNKLILSFGGNDISGAKGVYFDWLQIQTGIGNVAGKQYQDSSSIVAGYLTDWYNGVPITRQAVGGGGGGINIYNTDSLLAGDRIVGMNGKTLHFNENTVDVITLSGVNFGGTLTDGTAQANYQIVADAGDNTVRFRFQADDGVANPVEILGNAITSRITYTADKHIFPNLDSISTPYNIVVMDGDTLKKAANTLQYAFNGSVAVADNPKIDVGTNFLDIGTTDAGATSTNTGGLFKVTATGALDGSGLYAATIRNDVVNNGGSNFGLSVTSTNSVLNVGLLASADYIAIQGVSSSVAFEGDVTGSGTAFLGNAIDGYGAALAVNPASTNTVVHNMFLSRGSSGTAADGIGFSIDLANQTDNGSGTITNQIISKWTTAANATRTSQLSFTGVNSAVTTTLLTLSGNAEAIFNGPIRLKGYTVAALPTGVQGDKAFVTNALGPAYHVTVVGGGAVVTPVFFDGSNWIVD